MIVVTGAVGFIGSCMITKLNDEGYTDIILVDDFNREQKNLEGKKFYKKIDREYFFSEINKYTNEIDFIVHIGARTDTTEFNKSIFKKLNFEYSKDIWFLCTTFNIPLIYVSSAATYGKGDLGYDDKDLSIIPKLKPLNPYGDSKNDFDKWILEQTATPPNWYGLKFFNVFGPNEYHKDRMASVVLHSYNQIKETGKMKLFRSHNPNFKDGEQMRDFIYVKDVIDVMYYLMDNKPKSDIYNLGSGKANTFLDLTKNVFKSLNIKEDIEFIDTPVDIRDKYQYFTEAKMNKLKSIGYSKKFHTFGDAIDDYVNNYLIYSKRM